MRAGKYSERPIGPFKTHVATIPITFKARYTKTSEAAQRYLFIENLPPVTISSLWSIFKYTFVAVYKFFISSF